MVRRVRMHEWANVGDMDCFEIGHNVHHYAAQKSIGLTLRINQKLHMYECEYKSEHLAGKNNFTCLLVNYVIVTYSKYR